MNEVIGLAVNRCLRVMDVVSSRSLSEISENMAGEIQVRLQKVLRLLQGFEKTAWLKTKKGKEAAQRIEEAAMSLEKTLSSPGKPQSIIKSLTILEQRVESLQKTIERLKRVFT